jgi:hypothetical protein
MLGRGVACYCLSAGAPAVTVVTFITQEDIQVALLNSPDILVLTISESSLTLHGRPGSCTVAILSTLCAGKMTPLGSRVSSIDDPIRV